MSHPVPALRSKLRPKLLRLIALACSLSATVAMLDPDRVATVMGEFPVGVNGYSQFFAIHVGVRFATAILALLAARDGDQFVLGDITALFILAQPAGRLIASFAIGLPEGLLLAVSGLEVAGGLLLLALRPRPLLITDDIRHQINDKQR